MKKILLILLGTLSFISCEERNLVSENPLTDAIAQLITMTKQHGESFRTTAQNDSIKLTGYHWLIGAPGKYPDVIVTERSDTKETWMIVLRLDTGKTFMDMGGNGFTEDSLEKDFYQDTSNPHPPTSVAQLNQLYLHEIERLLEHGQ